MKNKALLVAAAVLAVGAGTSMAQVYSANAVGYVNLTLDSGFNIIANPLNNTNNNLNTILASAPTGTRVYRFDPVGSTYVSSSKLPVGWAPDLTFDPGEGFFISVPAGGPINVTFVGEVPQGDLSNPLVTSAFQIKASQVPQALPLGRPGAANPTLEFPATANDRVFLFDNVLGYNESYTYNATIGWLGPNSNGGDGPTIPVASGFFLQRVGSGDWTRSFSVN